MKQLVVHPFVGSFVHPFYRQQFGMRTPASFRYSLADPRLLDTGMKSDISKGLSGRNIRQVPRYVALALIERGCWPSPKFAGMGGGSRDLIHSCQYLLRDEGPWVVDFEDVTTFAWYSRRLLERRWIRDRARRTLGSSECRALLPWTKAARRSLEAALGDEYAGKTAVVYPYVEPKDQFARSHDRPIVLFVGSAFYPKGGYETLLAFDRIHRQFPDALLRIVSFVPRDVREKFAGAAHVEFHERVPTDLLDEFYREATLLCFPTHLDTLGFVIFEAYSWAVPVVGTRHYAVPELIEDGVSGILVDTDVSYFDEEYMPRYGPVRGWGSDTYSHPLVRQLMDPSDVQIGRLADAMSRVLGDDGLRKRLSAGALDLVSKGRFSASHRSAVLERTYLEAAAK